MLGRLLGRPRSARSSARSSSSSCSSSSRRRSGRRRRSRRCSTRVRCTASRPSAVALLMIGGEFDLSAGVAVITAALVASMTAYQLSVNVWVGVAVSLIVALAIGALNGYLLVQDAVAQLPRHARHVLHADRAPTSPSRRSSSGGVATQNISNIDGFDRAKAIFASEFTIGGDHAPDHAAVVGRCSSRWRPGCCCAPTSATGSSRSGGADASARAVGVPVNRVKIGLFMRWRSCAGSPACTSCSRSTPCSPARAPATSSCTSSRRSWAAACSPAGTARPIGAAIGAFIFGMTEQGIVLAGWEADWFKFFLGAMLLGAHPAERVRPTTGGDDGNDRQTTDTRPRAPLVRLTGAGKYYGNIIALTGIDLEVGAGRGDVRARRQRRRQVHPDQDHRRAAPARRGHVRGRAARRSGSARPARRSTGASRPCTRTSPWCR